MNNESKKNEIDQNAAPAIEKAELEAISIVLRLRTGLQAGAKRSFVPCV